ncbi:MAG: branched-chain amino acid ABC transporter substrate-binding protein [Anaerolineae bacterium]|jgi:branched-chain amino acid transport system substrate-binding protein|nr:MAG: branched-chain amino acid ABC transporter substrate-binding protein [Anaerolineae bacterium]
MQRFLVFLVILGMALSACEDEPEKEDENEATREATEAAQVATEVVVAEEKVIKIGLATDLSNVLPAPGLDIAQAAQLAVDQFNAEGGLLGYQIELVIEDDQCTGEGATTVANLFASDPDLYAVVGHVCSGASIPASDVYADARIPMVSPSSTAGAFTARGLDVANRVAFNDNIQGVVAARYIYDVLESRRIAVLHDNSSYGEGLASTVADTFESLGGDILSFEVIDPEDQDYRPVLTVIAEQNPDLIYLGGYQNQAALLVAQMVEVGMDDVIFFSDDGVYTQDFLDLAGEFSEGVYVSFGAQIGDAALNADFDLAYEESFGVRPDELGPYHAQAYDAANMILSALEAVAALDENGELVIDREALIKAVRETENMEGVSGMINCEANGDCGTVVIDIFRAEQGAWVKMDVPEELQVSSIN